MSDKLTRDHLAGPPALSIMIGRKPLVTSHSGRTPTQVRIRVRIGDRARWHRVYAEYQGRSAWLFVERLYKRVYLSGELTALVLGTAKV